MTKKKIDQKPSNTALTTAFRRAIANMEFKHEKQGPDDLAISFLPLYFKFFLKFKRMREFALNKLDEMVPGLTEYLIARTAFFDKLFVDAQNNMTPQIVLLGAGYDSRAYRFSNSNLGTKIFELDAASTQKRKRKCLKKAQIDIPKHVTLVPINFNQDPLKETLEKAGYKNNKKTLFIWEGVSYYLEFESVESTLALVSLSSHHESSIAFDYTISISKDNIDNYYGVKKFTQAMNKHHANEKLIFSINESEIKSFLEQRGLKINDHMDNEEIEKSFLLDEKGTLIGHTTGHFRFAIASPKGIF